MMYKVDVFMNMDKAKAKEFDSYVEAYKYAHTMVDLYVTCGATITRLSDGTVLKSMLEYDSSCPEFNVHFELNGEECYYNYHESKADFFNRVEEFAKHGEYNMRERAEFFDEAYAEYGTAALLARF